MAPASVWARPERRAESCLWPAEHWLAIANAALLLVAGLAVMEPLLRASGYVTPADLIFNAYSWFCHQMPSRSYFIAGQQMAYCERNTAIYGSMALGGLLWPHVRQKLSWPLFVLMCLPMAVDGFTQLAGLRESTWQLRTLTGALFGLACVWFGYPLVDRLLRRELLA